MIRRFNRWFDDLPEPRRTTTFFAALLPISTLSAWPLLWLPVASALILMRVWWLYVANKRG